MHPTQIYYFFLIINVSCFISSHLNVKTECFIYRTIVWVSNTLACPDSILYWFCGMQSNCISVCVIKIGITCDSLDWPRVYDDLGLKYTILMRQHHKKCHDHLLLQANTRNPHTQIHNHFMYVTIYIIFLKLSWNHILLKNQYPLSYCFIIWTQFTLQVWVLRKRGISKS